MYLGLPREQTGRVWGICNTPTMGPELPPPSYTGEQIHIRGSHAEQMFQVGVPGQTEAEENLPHRITLGQGLMKVRQCMEALNLQLKRWGL